ncbi:hypothetical protein T552_04177 [Pneumocystis carinii B80]|uniref:Uncharacterized protein n=1 Tax=Pneumocystis carinii (strain B80) TaxID=1408658 RepID=A0A0W4ZED8_PNEC8|nr:hypothetical protein T552_04177 [Pneumocystis carinii B80]KTW26752.1 hypothetical protein T552_04177 [Pneumocystis carinii B80]
MSSDDSILLRRLFLDVLKKINKNREYLEIKKKGLKHNHDYTGGQKDLCDVMCSNDDLLKGRSTKNELKDHIFSYDIDIVFFWNFLGKN